jgi:hypothetical protein
LPKLTDFAKPTYQKMLPLGYVKVKLILLLQIKRLLLEPPYQHLSKCS